MAITHSKVSAKTDSADTTKVLPSDWNADHETPTITLTGVDPLTLTGDALVYLELRSALNWERIRGANGVPTKVTRGIIEGFSLPVYAANSEELYFNCCVPDRWQEATDIVVHCYCYLPSANTDKKFNLRLEWEHCTVGDLVPATDNDVDVETDTGTAGAYKSFEVLFAIDYDIDSGDAILPNDELHFRLTRLDATSAEITGEVVITHLGIVYQRNKLGDAV